MTAVFLILVHSLVLFFRNKRFSVYLYYIALAYALCILFFTISETIDHCLKFNALLILSFTSMQMVIHSMVKIQQFGDNMENFSMLYSKITIYFLYVYFWLLTLLWLSEFCLVVSEFVFIV